MLFMTKSALCIGVVSVLAMGAAGGGDMRDAIESGSREAVAGLGRACAASKDCVDLGSRIASAAVGQPAAASESVVQAGIARTSDALAVKQAPTPSAPALDVGHAPYRGERHVRRTAAMRE